MYACRVLHLSENSHFRLPICIVSLGNVMDGTTILGPSLLSVKETAKWGRLLVTISRLGMALQVFVRLLGPGVYGKWCMVYVNRFWDLVKAPCLQDDTAGVKASYGIPSLAECWQLHVEC